MYVDNHHMTGNIVTYNLNFDLYDTLLLPFNLDHSAEALNNETLVVLLISVAFPIIACHRNDAPVITIICLMSGWLRSRCSTSAVCIFLAFNFITTLAKFSLTGGG